jgi:hypothetical protein
MMAHAVAVSMIKMIAVQGKLGVPMSQGQNALEAETTDPVAQVVPVVQVVRPWVVQDLELLDQAVTVKMADPSQGAHEAMDLEVLVRVLVVDDQVGMTLDDVAAKVVFEGGQACLPWPTRRLAEKFQAVIVSATARRTKRKERSRTKRPNVASA